jgi:hypothetical protein
MAVFVLPTTGMYNPRALSRGATDRTPSPHAAAQTKARTRPGRPPVHNETWSKVSVVLFDRQVHHLDRLTKDMRDRNGKAMNRAEVIRALIDGLIESGMDLADAGSEATLRARIARRLGTPYR